MTDRPFRSSKIDDLEAVFARADAANDVGTIARIAEELTHRRVERARALLRRVSATLGRLGHTAPMPPEWTSADRRTEPKPASRPAPRPGPAKMPPPEADLPDIADLGEPTRRARPARDDTPEGILAAWTALEALSPSTFRRPEDLVGGDRRAIARLDEAQLPWERGERSRPNRRLFYRVVLGTIPMDRATDALMKAFGADEEKSRREREQAAVAVVLVDTKGVPVQEDAVAVSSFAWALPSALAGDPSGLGAWTGVETRLRRALDTLVRRRDAEGEPLPLDRATIARAHTWLVRQLGIPADLVEPPRFACRIYHYFRARKPPEPLLLNSFFLRDLGRAEALISGSDAGAGLRRYLGVERLPERSDLLSDGALLETLVAPRACPPVRWPAPGGHPLVLLQQAAVNGARDALAGKAGLYAVNGPPGTGKTTLLRDLVAACVHDRARAMCTFDDPEDAFTASGEKVAVGNGAFMQVYRVDDRLKGHEILVASSNNKAVENVSRELPGHKAVSSLERHAYFRHVADAIATPRDPEEPDILDMLRPAEPVTWGLIAAVLGNAANRYAFQQTFWWDEENGFRTLLRAAKGDDVLIEEDRNGRLVRRRPAVAVAEAPPTGREEALRAWRRAREGFRKLDAEVSRVIAAVEAVRAAKIRLPVEQARLREAENTAAAAAKHHTQTRIRAESARAASEAARGRADAAIRARSTHRPMRPGFFARLFGTKSWVAWRQVDADLAHDETAAKQVAAEAENARAVADGAFGAAVVAARDALARLEEAQATLARTAAEITAHEAERAGRADDPFAIAGLPLASADSTAYRDLHLAAPWLPDRVHALRERLFQTGLDVQRAFVFAAAQKVLHNVGHLMGAESPLTDERRKVLLPDVWATLFMIVPVVSTTFASVDRMLGDLGAESLGWLLVDEAGQALPQAAIGAITRARRTIVVGDPLQIPPVVSLPDRLTQKICGHFRVDPTEWAAPIASVQTLADRASPITAVFRTRDGPRTVGAPLLVHRRCGSPMFEISNRVAYGGLMVHAPNPPTDGARAIEAVLEPSSWLDVDGPATTKWCPLEGEVLVALLKRLADAEAVARDLYVVSPFRIVANELVQRLERESALKQAIGWSTPGAIRERVGTVHVVQGREADAVVMVLGAPASAQHGARMWAGGTPNMVNVAVTRAKSHLTVIGSHAAWSGAGAFAELAKLPRRPAPR